MTAEQLYSKFYYELIDQIDGKYPILSTESVIVRVLVDLKDCPATTELGFKKWANAYLRRAADKKLDEQSQTLEGVLENAKRDTGTKPPFVYETSPYNPDIAFVQIMHRRRQFIWVIQSSKLAIAEVLHPTIRVRFTRVGRQSYPFLIKLCQQQTYSGAWRTVERDLASIWFNFPFSADLVASDGWLNFLPGNIGVAHPDMCAINDLDNPDAPPSRHAELRKESDANEDDWVPARSTARPIDREKLKPAPFNEHEAKVYRWLHSVDVDDLAAAATSPTHVWDGSIQNVRSLQKDWGVRASN